MKGILLILGAVVASALGAPKYGRILGGTNANPQEFPHMVSIRGSSGGHFCGGSIISQTVILTAAHCVIGNSPSQIYIVSGSTTLNSGGNRHNVQQIITNSGYNPDFSWRNDIAILKLQTSITLSPSEQIIPIPIQDENPGDDTGSRSQVSGWGSTTYPGSNTPNNLQKLDLFLVPLSTCNLQHDYIIYDTQICAGTITGEGVCGGDSGSPLISNGKQVGLVSWGRSCATGVADVYTRVASYANWIAQNSK